MDYLKNLLPKSLKSHLRRLWLDSLDAMDRIFGRTDPLIPPRSKIHDIGGGDFKRIGEEFLQYFVELAHLMPDHRALDVGCGYGRMAVPLTRYLTGQGAYRGFDIKAEAIAWCQDKISARWDNFHFEHANIYNGNYNPLGVTRASEYEFPYQDESFDFVVLTSVFTHMLAPDLENYLAEIARVLKPAGKSLISYLLLNEESLRLMDTGNSWLNLRYTLENGATVDEKNPEITLGYYEPFIRRLYKKKGLTIEEPIRFGSWCGRAVYLSFQDLIIASKKAPEP